MKEKVSVIMSTYKTDRNILTESINSILKQTYSNFEFIIVCDGDSDEYKFLKSFRDRRIRLIKNNKNMGLAYSLNKAIQCANGNYIARMDSDDISLPNRLENQVDYLNKNPNIYLCSTYVEMFGDSFGKKKVYLKSCDEIKSQLLYRAVLIHPTVMGRREIFDKYKYNNDFLCSQDFELWSRISEEYNISIIPVVCLKYRIHNKQASIEKRQMQVEFSKRIIKENSKKITGNFDEKIYKCLCVLSGREKINKNNYLLVSNEIDYIISQNKIYNHYDQKCLKKVLYNRYFELLLKNKIFTLHYSALNKILRLYNLNEICFKL